MQSNSDFPCAIDFIRRRRPTENKSEKCAKKITRPERTSANHLFTTLCPQKCHHFHALFVKTPAKIRPIDL
jgi:hypothetical protein